MDNKNKEVKPWYKRTWTIVVFVIFTLFLLFGLFSLFGLWFLFSLGSESIPNEYDILYSDYINYHNTYLDDIEKMNKLTDEWNDVINNYNLYTDQGYITKLTEIASEYINTYEYYQVHQQEYITFLEKNKENLEYSLEDFSVIETKRNIQNNDILFRQNIQEMIDDLNSLITSLEQQQSSEEDITSLEQQQSFEEDIQALKDLANLFTLFI